MPTFRNLAAVRDGRLVFPTPEIADALSFRNVVSLPWALDRLEDATDAGPHETLLAGETGVYARLWSAWQTRSATLLDA